MTLKAHKTNFVSRVSQTQFVCRERFCGRFKLKEFSRNGLKCRILRIGALMSRLCSPQQLDGPEAMAVLSEALVTQGRPATTATYSRNASCA